MHAWAGALLRACAIANGGGFLIRQELGDTAADILKHKSSRAQSSAVSHGGSMQHMLSYADDEDEEDVDMQNLDMSELMPEQEDRFSESL
jgi:hypothetical protein